MTSTPSPPDPTWRAVEAAVFAGFAYAVGFGLPLAVVVGLLALAVNAAEILGARYGRAVALRHAALAVALVVLCALAVARGAVWFPVVAAPLVAWFLLDALAHLRGDVDRGRTAGRSGGPPDADRADAVDPDFAGELLRELRESPRRPAALAAALDREPARVRGALGALAEAGTLERDDAGRYRVAGPADATAAALSLPARALSRLAVPFRALA